MKQPLISIIVPIYNVEQYLADCLDSILEQTYSNLEIILVNDGSTDSSEIIAKEYEERDSRIQLFNKTNGGAADAKNYGLDKVTGEYLLFVDSDDLISPYHVENLLGAIRRYNVPLSMCKVTRKRSELEKQENSNARVIKGDIAVLAGNLGINTDHAPMDSPWDKLYHKSIFNHLRYPKGMIYEDSAIIFQILDRVEAYAIVDSIDYFYRVMDNSVTTKGISKKNFDLLKKNQMQVDFLKEKHSYALKFGYQNALNANDFWAMNAIKESTEISKQFFNAIWEQNKEYSKQFKLRRILYFSRYGYMILIKLASVLYNQEFLKKVLKSLLMRK